jgi:hypothetical protein
MPRFMSLSPTNAELQSLNRCRLFLQVSFLSEICSSDGLTITEDAWRGKRFEIPSKLLSWPRQQCPPTKDWLTWQTFLKNFFLFRGLRLRTPLGAWLRAEEGWEWFYSPSRERIFKLEHNGWRAFPQIHRRGKLPTFDLIGEECQLPNDLCRTMIYFNKSRIVCTGYASFKLSPPCATNLTTPILTHGRAG